MTRKKITTSIKLNRLLLSLFVAGIFIVGCKDDDEIEIPEENIVEVARETDGLDSLVALIESNGFSTIASELKDSNITFFAPNNEAFRSLLTSIEVQSVAEIRSDVLNDMLNYHIVKNNNVTTGELEDTYTTSFNDEEININRGDPITINDETQPSQTSIVNGDVPARNGMIHIIDEFLLPSRVVEDVLPFGTIGALISMRAGFTLFADISRDAGVMSGLRNLDNQFTVIAPFDQSLNNFLSNIGNPDQQFFQALIGYHIIQGESTPLAELERKFQTLSDDTVYITHLEDADFINGTQAIDLSFVANNGRLHILGQGVLIPPSLRGPHLADYINGFATSNNNPEFTIMNAAIQKVSALVNLFEGDAPVTVFTPTDEAFEDADITIDTVENMEPGEVENLVKYHTLPGVYFFVDFIKEAGDNNEIAKTTLQGDDFTLDFSGENPSIIDQNNETSNAQLVSGNANLPNGVFYEIDQVMKPN